MFHRKHVVVVVVALGMLASACGARLTAAQRAAGIGVLAAAGPGGGNNPGNLGGNGNGVTPSIGPNGSLGPGTGPSSGPSAGPTTCTGTGGATDKGVTANKITIATIADVNGVQPGLFRSAWQAMQAWAAMVNSQGGICGRSIDLQLLDSKTDEGATRTAVLQGCNDFALIGNMSAFDDGGSQAVAQCKIPDLSAVTTSLSRISGPYSYAVYPNRPDWFVAGSAAYIAQKCKTTPAVCQHSADLYLNTTTTSVNAKSKRVAYGKYGFNFDPNNGGYQAETGVVETNYTPYVQQMRSKGIEYVTMTSDYQSIGRLTQAMKQQRWYPKVMEWDSVVYSPAFLQQVQGAADGSYVYLNVALFSEVAKNPEMQLYEQWLSRVAPGVQPDYFGLYAWSAGRLFQQLATQIGAHLTRAAFLSALAHDHSWDGHGLHAAHDVGSKLPSPCTMDVQIQHNQFVRLEPATGFNCSTPLYHET